MRWQLYGSTGSYFDELILVAVLEPLTLFVKRYSDLREASTSVEEELYGGYLQPLVDLELSGSCLRRVKV